MERIDELDKELLQRLGCYMEQEPPKAQVTLYHFYSIVENVYEKDGVWWVQFGGSRESMSYGKDKPFEPGDKVMITTQKDPRHAKPSQPPV